MALELCHDHPYSRFENMTVNTSVKTKDDRDIDRDFQELKQLKKVKFKGKSGVKLGQGSYASVYKANYMGVPCAVKQLDRNDVAGVASKKEKEARKELRRCQERNFKLECIQHYKLQDPNVVRMLGVFYQAKLPVLVMELMEFNLTQLLGETPNIIMYVKLSILQDVSKGLRYLHTQNPPIVHHALYSDNILFTKGLIAKIGDFKTGAETVSEQAVLSVRRNERSNDFLPDSYDVLRYDLPLNVFSFGCIVCHVITQKWPSAKDHHFMMSFPTPSKYKKVEGAIGSNSDGILNDWCVEKHQRYIDQIADDKLKYLVAECLQCNAKYRPEMLEIEKRITSVMRDHCNDDDIKKVYSSANVTDDDKDDDVKGVMFQAIKQEIDQSIRNFQLLLVGEPRAGKTSLVSSFLGEDFVENQPGTVGADEEICKVYSRNWTRIKDSDREGILETHLTNESRQNIMKKLVELNPPILSSSLSSIPSTSQTSTCESPRRYSYIDSNVVFTNSNRKSLRLSGASNTGENFSKATQNDSDNLIVSLWDFAGEAIFHNTHSVFISDSGVTVITFNASLIHDKCGVINIISSIHYWLQVVNSVCTAEGNVLFAGTHIDKLHPHLKKARNIAKTQILPEFERELFGKPYAKHIAYYLNEGLNSALRKSCFFISNKYQDQEIENLKDTAIQVAITLRAKQKPILMYLKMEKVLLQLEKKVIEISTMLDLVKENTFSLNENSPEFKDMLKYFHNNRTIIYFNEIECLKGLVILSPNWLAKLFSYIITAISYKDGETSFYSSYKRLKKYGILHEDLLQHMLEKFYLDFPVTDRVKLTKENIVNILVHFGLLVCITREAWFAEEGFPSLPDSGDTYIVPSAIQMNDRSPPKSEEERIIYYQFSDGFIPISLLNQLIAKCICRSVTRNDRLLWMRREKIGSQLGADQKYYISRCEEKQSIQLTITVVEDNEENMQFDKEHVEERRHLIRDIEIFLDDIMKVLMPTKKRNDRPKLMVPCKHCSELPCSELHITYDDVCSGKIIMCPNENDINLPRGYYSEFSLAGLSYTSGDDSRIRCKRKYEAFRRNYVKLVNLNLKNLRPVLFADAVITQQESQSIQRTVDGLTAATQIVETILTSLQPHENDEKFDKFLNILEKHGDADGKRLARQIKHDSGTADSSTRSSHQDADNPHGLTGNTQQDSSPACCKCCNLL